MSDVAFWGQGNEPALQPFRSALRAEWERRGYEFVEGQDPNAACVFNFIDPADMTASEFGDLVKADAVKWERIVRDADVKSD